MKILKKFFTVTLSMTIVMLMLISMTSCGKPDSDPEEAANIYLDMIFKADKSKIDKINFSENDFNNLRSSIESIINEKLNSIPLDLTVDEKKELNKNIIQALPNIKYEVTDVQSDIMSTKVTFTIQPIDANSMLKKIKAELREREKTDLELKNSDDKYYAEGVKLMNSYLQSPDMCSKNNKVEIKLDTEDNNWRISDSSLQKILSSSYEK